MANVRYQDACLTTRRRIGNNRSSFSGEQFFQDQIQQVPVIHRINKTPGVIACPNFVKISYTVILAGHILFRMGVVGGVVAFSGCAGGQLKINIVEFDDDASVVKASTWAAVHV